MSVLFTNESKTVVHLENSGKPRVSYQEDWKTYRILDPITPSAQSIILEVEELEARMDIFDEFADL